MDSIRQLIQAMNFVKNPLTLIAFLIVSAIAALLLILKQTNGLDKAQTLLLRDASLGKGEFSKIVNRVIYAVLAFAAMLLALLAFDMHNAYTNARMQDAIKEQLSQRGIPCHGDTCTGKSPQQTGCASPATPTIGVSEGSVPVNGQLKYVKVQFRYSPLCRASWVKATKVAGAKIWVEDESKRPLAEPYTIPESKITDDYHTDMVSGEIKSRGCFQLPGTEAICTGYLQP
jgi:Protein of unknown function (DUF2690)